MEARNNDGETALEMASITGGTSVAHVLLDAGEESKGRCSEMTNGCTGVLAANTFPSFHFYSIFIIIFSVVTFTHVRQKPFNCYPYLSLQYTIQNFVEMLLNWLLSQSPGFEKLQPPPKKKEALPVGIIFQSAFCPCSGQLFFTFETKYLPFSTAFKFISLCKHYYFSFYISFT